MEKEVIVLGLYSPNSQMGGRVFDVRGIAPTVMAGTHGYGFGCILLYEEDDTDKCDGRGLQVSDDEHNGVDADRQPVTPESGV